MENIIIIYSSVDGQTKAICERMGQFMTESAAVRVMDVKETDEKNIRCADKILIGASIRYGKHRPEVLKLIKQHHAILEEKISGFFTVNVVARKPNKNTPDTNPYMKKFLQISPWTPTVKGVFAGKINYPLYGFFDRTMIRFIMWMTKGPTDITGCYEFTDWQAVENFAQHFVTLSHSSS